MLLLFVPKSLQVKVMEDLTFLIPNYANPKKKIKLTFYEQGQGENMFWLPRFYALGHPGLTIVLPSPDCPMQPGLSLNGQLMETADRPQQSVLSATIAQLEKLPGAMIVMPCGTGKTNTAIAIAVRLGVRTAVLCHNASLMDQWAGRIHEFVKGGAKVGRLRQNVVDVAGCDFVVCSIQSILSRDYPAEATAFGLVLVDEAHHIGAPTFSRVLSKLHYRYSIGLSATPKRKDKMEEMIYKLIGKPSYVLTKAKRSDVQVNMVTYGAGAEVTITYKNGTVGMSKMVTNLTKDRERNALLVKMVRAMVSQNRHGLLLSDRVDHLKTLRDLLGADECAIITGAINTQVAEAKAKDKQTEDKDKTKNKDKTKKKTTEELVFDKPLTLSTYHMFAEAVDFTGDFIILATPRTAVEQCTGRILRGHSDNTPVIIDVVDPFSVFFHMAKKRRAYYTKSGYAQFELDHSIF